MSAASLVPPMIDLVVSALLLFGGSSTSPPAQARVAEGALPAATHVKRGVVIVTSRSLGPRNATAVLQHVHIVLVRVHCQHPQRAWGPSVSCGCACAAPKAPCLCSGLLQAGKKIRCMYKQQNIAIAKINRA
jgi:hypothetical protein